MPKYRPINKIVKAIEFQMGNIRVKQSLPADGLNAIDPFVLLHHAGPFHINSGSDHRNMGVGPHPHRGFEPVSFVFQGSLQHRDSLGNDDILNDGDIQWMTSGKGIIHSERPPKKVTDEGGIQEFIQLWVNIPSKDKLTSPKYQNIRQKDFPVIETDKGKGKISLISGEYGKQTGPAHTFTPILAMKVEFEANAEKTFVIPSSYNLLLYVVKGRMRVNGSPEVDRENMICFGNEGDEIHVNALEPTWFLLLSGQPIKESIATYGPFVMNNNQEIMEAIRDYQDGKMGELIEKFD